MKCKRRKAVFGLDDAIMLIGTAITAGTQINNAIQNKKNLQAQQRAQNMANIDEQNGLLQQNLGTLANNRDYIDDRQNQIVLKTRNDNQLKYGGDTDKEREKIDWQTVRDYVSLLPGKIKRGWKKARNNNSNILNNPIPTREGIEEIIQSVARKVNNDTTYNSGLYKGEYKDRFLNNTYKKRKID